MNQRFSRFEYYEIIDWNQVEIIGKGGSRSVVEEKNEIEHLNCSYILLLIDQIYVKNIFFEFIGFELNRIKGTNVRNWKIELMIY